MRERVGAGVLALGAGILVGSVALRSLPSQADRHGGWVLGAAFGVASLILLFASLQRDRDGTRTRATAWMWFLVAGVLVVRCGETLGAPFDVGGSLVPDRDPHEWCGLRSVSWALLPAIASMAVLSAVSRWSRSTALFGVAALATLCVTAAYQRCSSPDLERYFGALPVLARLPVVAVTEDLTQPEIPRGPMAWEGMGMEVIEMMHRMRFPQRDAIPLGEFVLHRKCQLSCRFGLASRRRGAQDAPPVEVVWSGLSSGPHTVLVDEPRRLMIIHDGRRMVWLDLRTGRAVPVSVLSLRPALAPPRQLLTLGLLGLLGSIALLMVRPRVRGVPAQATLREDSVLYVEGRVVRAPVPKGIAPGPVVVFLPSDVTPEHHRDGMVLETVAMEPGTLDGLATRHASSAAARTRVALALALACGAPLATVCLAPIISRQPMP